jgi:flagellar biosynthesis/type III secretory pathway M-ring protein FliF/YscJ
MLNERKPTVAGGKPTPRTPQEIQQLENIVKAAVGFTNNDTRQDMMQSQEVAFADLFDESTPAPAKQTMQQQINDYLPYITQGCLILLAIGILLYFRSVFLSPVGKTAGGESDSFEALLTNYQNHANGTNGHVVSRTGAGQQGPSILTPAELSRLIRENPDNASQALKAWLRRN